MALPAPQPTAPTPERPRAPALAARGLEHAHDRPYPPVPRRPTTADPVPRHRPRGNRGELSRVGAAAAARPHLLRRQGQPGAGRSSPSWPSSAPASTSPAAARSISASRPAYPASASPSATPSRKQTDIACAFEQGVRLFAFDSDGELDKLAAAAPGAGVFCRILTDGQGADWPLSRKFGCGASMAAALLLRAKREGPRSLRHLLPCRLAADGAPGLGQGRARGGESSAACARTASTCACSISAAASDPLPHGRAGHRGLRRRRHEGGDAPLRQRPAGHDRGARPRAGRRRRRHPGRGRADLAQGLCRPQALGLSRHRQVRRAGRDHGRGDQSIRSSASARAARPARS